MSQKLQYGEKVLCVSLNSPFGFLAITMVSIRTRIFTFLECQEMCAGRVEISGNSRKSLFSKNVRKFHKKDQGYHELSGKVYLCRLYNNNL